MKPTKPEYCYYYALWLVVLWARCVRLGMVSMYNVWDDVQRLNAWFGGRFKSNIVFFSFYHGSIILMKSTCSNMEINHVRLNILIMIRIVWHIQVMNKFTVPDKIYLLVGWRIILTDIILSCRWHCYQIPLRIYDFTIFLEDSAYKDKAMQMSSA